MIAIYIICAVIVVLLICVVYSLGRIKGMEEARELTVDSEVLLENANKTIRLCEKMAETNNKYQKLVEDQYELWELTCKSLGIKTSADTKKG